MRRYLGLIVLAAAVVTALGQKTVPGVAHEYVAAHQAELLEQFKEFIAIPNVAADPAGLKRNADFLLGQLRRRGVAAQLLTAPGLPEQTPPVVYGELKAQGATRTIVFYAHYDGQPVTPSEWDSPPFSGLVKGSGDDQRIYGRGTGDDKAAIFAQLTALDAFGSGHLVPKANIRFVWEGEEEAGSAHLEQILDAHKELIGGDIWLVCDGPVDQTRRQQLVFGARGDAHVQITLFGPKPALHSGHYGNWAPNPAMMMAQLLGGMKDQTGHVTIPHFYEGVKPLGSLERAALAAAPVNDEMLRREFGLGTTMGGGKHLLELLNEPSLEVAGIAAGQTGSHATNSIPTRAVANLDLRLVVGNDAKVQQQRVVDYVRSQGFLVMTTEPTHEDLVGHMKIAWMETPPGENASRTPMDLPIAKDVVAAVERRAREDDSAADERRDGAAGCDAESEWIAYYYGSDCEP